MAETMAVHVPVETTKSLQGPDFDAFDESLGPQVQVCLVLCLFYITPGACDYVKETVDKEVMRQFVVQAQKGYSPNKFHNFAHALDVAYEVSLKIRLVEAGRFMYEVGTQQFWLLLAALGLDLGHVGVDNQFLIETQHELAVTYNDRSPLENLHCSRLFQILGSDDANVLKALDKDVAEVSQQVKSCQSVEGLQNCYRVLKNEDDCTYPAGTRAFKTAAAQSELDEPLSACTGGNQTLTIVLKQGSRRREAMKGMHHECSNSLNVCMFEGLDETLGELKFVTTTQTFHEAFLETIPACTSAKVSELGLDRVDFRTVGPEPVDAVCDKLRAKIADHEAARDKHRKASEEKGAKRRKELDEKAAKTKPEEMFDKPLAMKMK
ncbi:unnamed protein product [Prorocentrum cordatum]|uniref:PDEase domain-containing protein n=1 Tax=Prorocentrum cordatum TaxID=2364126 RepID=A0ABN9RJX2_9DINO|nr:unnamed protein product [Polarella glacialis]